MSLRQFRLAVIAFAGALLAGCAHPLPALIGREVLIPPWRTEQDPPQTALRRVLYLAAAIAIDHGYRYFELLDPISPGARIRVRLYRTGEVAASPPTIYDAANVLEGESDRRAVSLEQDANEK